MLIFNGCSSHLTAEFINYCWNHNIIPFCLPPHSTHILQSLDVRCFQPLKHYHSIAIDEAIMTGDDKFDKIEFFAAYERMRARIFKQSTIQSAF